MNYSNNWNSNSNTSSHIWLKILWRLKSSKTSHLCGKYIKQKFISMFIQKVSCLIRGIIEEGGQSI